MLTTWHEASRKLAPLELRHASSLAPVDASLVGRTLAKDVTAREANPRFRMSAMDGWAIHKNDMDKSTVAADPRSTVLAGMQASILQEGTSYPVMTGAPVPAEAAAVIPVEDVREENGMLTWKAGLRESQNIRQAGEDFVAGDVLLQAGTVIVPHHMVLLRTAGVTEVEACGRPRVALVQTGNELAYGNQPLAEGAVPESTSECLLETLRRLGVDSPGLQRVRDDRDSLRGALQQALTGADLILTTGGVSKGVADHIPDVVQELGGEILLHRLAIKPAKPLLVARFPSGTVLVGLPGNPISQLLAFQAVAMPLLAGRPALAGMQTLPATLLEPCKGKETFRTFLRGVVSVSPQGQFCVRPLTGNESHRVRNLAACNAWIHISGQHAEGELVEVSPFMDIRWSLPPCLA